MSHFGHANNFHVEIIDNPDGTATVQVFMSSSQIKGTAVGPESTPRLSQEFKCKSRSEAEKYAKSLNLKIA